MKTIQIFDTDEEEIGLFQYDENKVPDVNEFINGCVEELKDDEHFMTNLIIALKFIGIERIFIDEIIHI